MKSLDRERRFKGERYVDLRPFFAGSRDQSFFIKGKCKADSDS